VVLTKTEKQRKRKDISNAWKWGKREHRFEAIMTKLLWLSVAVIGANLLAISWKWNEDVQGWLTSIAFVLVSMCLVARLLTEFCHRLERYYFNPHRFGHKKKHILRAILKG